MDGHGQIIVAEAKQRFFDFLLERFCPSFKTDSEDQSLMAESHKTVLSIALTTRIRLHSDFFLMFCSESSTFLDARGP